MKEKAFLYWLITTEGIGCKTYQKIIEQGLTPEEIFELSEEYFVDFIKKIEGNKKVYINLKNRREQYSKERILEEYSQFLQTKTELAVWGSEGYPKRLYSIPDPPLKIFYKGTLPKEESLKVAVIGARDCSEYGRYVAQELGKELARNDIELISGMARGVDSVSQNGAMEEHGKVFAVLGCGVEKCYPQSSQRLYEQLCETKGCGVLSEYLPHTVAKPELFPPRNRIISGLSDVVVVVEARQKSGTLITVDMALEQGKDVYAVPGRITDRLSDGCNKMIREGAVPLLSPKELIMELKEKEQLIWNSVMLTETELCKQNNDKDISFYINSEKNTLCKPIKTTKSYIVKELIQQKEEKLCKLIDEDVRDSFTGKWNVSRLEELSPEGVSTDRLNSEGLNSDGLSPEGLNLEGLNWDGLSPEELNSDGLNSEGLVSEGLVSEGLNSNGLESKGSELNEIEKKINGILDFTPKSVDRIMKEIHCTEVGEVLTGLTSLQIKGGIGMKGNMYYKR